MDASGAGEVNVVSAALPDEAISVEVVHRGRRVVLVNDLSTIRAGNQHVERLLRMRVRAEVVPLVSPGHPN